MKWWWWWGGGGRFKQDDDLVNQWDTTPSKWVCGTGYLLSGLLQWKGIGKYTPPPPSQIKMVVSRNLPAAFLSVTQIGPLQREPKHLSKYQFWDKGDHKINPNCMTLVLIQRLGMSVVILMHKVLIIFYFFDFESWFILSKRGVVVFIYTNKLYRYYKRSDIQ